MTTEPATQATGAALLRRLGLACVLVAACARAVTTFDPLPGWGLDPLSTVAPHNGMAPAGVTMLSALAFLGLALTLAAAARSREAIPRVPLALALVGLLPIAYHGWLGPTASVENATTGLAWAGAIAGALAALIACRHAPERSIAIACCAGIVGPLAVRAGIQVYIEHPVLVEDFRNNREAFLASHGWTPGSAMARSFERRLTSPDASAWFAMSNVYASVMAGAAAVFAAACADAFRRKLWTNGERSDLYRTLGVAAGLILAIGGLFIAIPAGGDLPKGAAAALVLGLALVALTLAQPKLPALARLAARPALLGPALIALALLAVLARGLVGDRLGELSILFRFYYIQAALRMAAESPLWGVGPDGFQAAYLLTKNPLSPEEVSSPHSVLFDYLSTLGLLALAWCGLLIALASRAGRTLLSAAPPPTEETANSPARWLVTIILVSSVFTLAFETIPLAAAVPDAFGLLLVDGLTKLVASTLLWLGLAAALSSMPARVLALGGAATALAVLTHAQIELTYTDIAAGSWALLLLGCAAAPVATPAPNDRARPVLHVAAAAVTALLAVAILTASLPIRAWQRELRATARLAAEPTQFVHRAQALAAGTPDDSLDALFADLSEATGRTVPPTVEGFNEALDLFRLTRAQTAGDRLDLLARAPSTPSRATADAAVDLRIRLTALASALGRDPEPFAEQSLEIARWAADRWPEDSRSHRNLANALLQASDLAPRLAEPGDEIPHLLRAAELDPLNPHLARQIALRLRTAGRSEDAARWAATALANSDLRRLDPLAGLTESQVQEMRELAGEP